MRELLKRGVLLATALVVALAAPLSSQALGSEIGLPNAQNRYTYVATTVFGEGFSDVISGSETPAGHLAPFGSFQVSPRGRSITLNIDDFGTRDGLEVQVVVYKSKKLIFRGCIPVRSTRRLRGVTPDRPVWVFIGPVDDPSSCSAIATAGVATVGGVKDR